MCPLWPLHSTRCSIPWPISFHYAIILLYMTKFDNVKKVCKQTYKQAERSSGSLRHSYFILFYAVKSKVNAYALLTACEFTSSTSVIASCDSLEFCTLKLSSIAWLYKSAVILCLLCPARFDTSARMPLFLKKKLIPLCLKSCTLTVFLIPDRWSIRCSKCRIAVREIGLSKLFSEWNMNQFGFRYPCSDYISISLSCINSYTRSLTWRFLLLVLVLVCSLIQ